MQLTRTQLQAIGKMLVEGNTPSYLVNGDPASADRDDLPFLSVVAGAGEIQLDTDGQAWYFEWDRTHAVSFEKELEAPDTNDADKLAEWLSKTANEFNELVC